MSAYQPEGILFFRGRDDVIGFMNDFGSHWDGYRVDIAEVGAVDHETVLVSGRQIGRGLSSGLEISEPVYVAVRIRDGRIAGTYWHVKRDQALAAAGLG